ncbi:hypothetical protein FACS1894104_3290 [Actinomycetota bacterium]|nr:hypothetical protein FACS1894104_3290 [Actinomycetota bacterium]
MKTVNTVKTSGDKILASILAIVLAMMLIPAMGLATMAGASELTDGSEQGTLPKEQSLSTTNSNQSMSEQADASLTGGSNQSLQLDSTLSSQAPQALAGSLSLSPLANTWQVSNQTELQNAISKASDGDVIECTASFNINSAVDVLNKELTITSAGTGSYVLTAQSARHFSIDGSKLTVANLTLKGQGGPSYIGGIDAAQSTLTLSNAQIQNCFASKGGAIYADNSNVVLKDHSIISANGASSMGGGIYANNQTDITLYDNSEVSNNRSGADGGGINANDSSTVTLFSNSTVSANTATGTSGGIIANSASKVTLNDNSSVSNNTADNSYGGIFADSSIITLNNNSQVANNKANSYWGGGIGISGVSSKLTLNDSSSVTNNTAAYGGGGIDAGYKSLVTISGYSSVSGNKADNNGGAYGGNAGGINAGYDSTLIISENSKVTGNTASGSGGGIYADSALSVTLGDNSEISGNTAGVNGGGLYLGSNGILTTNGSVTFANNKAATLYLDATWPGTANHNKLTGVKDITPNFQFPPTYPEASKTNNNILAFNNYDISEVLGYRCFNVNFFDDDYVTLINNIAVIETGDAIAPADPVRNGYTFTGWDGAYTNVMWDTNVNATYDVIQYKVSFVPGTHGAFAPQVIDYLHYGDDTPDAPMAIGRAGWKFDGWSPALASTVSASITYVAQWQPVYHTLNYHGNGSDAGTVPAGETLQYGSAYTVADAGTMTRTGYTFAGWSTNPTGSSTHAVGSTHTIRADVHLYAIWTPNPLVPPVPPVIEITTYSVSYAAGGDNVTGLPTGAALEAGTDYTVTGDVPSRQGYEFSGWASSLGSNLQTGASFTMPEADVMLTATWRAEMVVAPTTTPESPVAATPTTANPTVAAAIDQGIPVLNIFGQDVPLVKPAGQTTWSLFDLLCMILALFALAITGIYSLIRNKGGYDSERKTVHSAFLIASILTTCLAAVLFALTQDITCQVVLFDIWSVAFIILLTATVVFARVAFIQTRRMQILVQEVEVFSN